MEERERDGTVVAARLHLGRGEARIRGRARRAGALRGLAVAAIAAGLVGAVLRAGWLPLSTLPETLDFGGGPRGALIPLTAVLLLAGCIVGGLIRMGVRARRPSAELWELALPRRERAEIGLADAAAALLTRAPEPGSPFELALLDRFCHLPLPAGEELRRAIPGLAPLRLVAALALAALAVGLPLEGRGVGVSPVAGNEPRPGTPGSQNGVHPPSLPAGRIDLLRRELELREGAARLLDGAPALAPLTAALREGGALELPVESAASLAAGDREPLRLAAAELRAGAARARADRGGEVLARRAEAWAYRLRAIAAGDLDEAAGAALPELGAAAAELALLAGAWQEGSGAVGSIAAASPEGAAGGRTPGAEMNGIDESRSSGSTPSGAEEPLELPPGLPIAPGESRPEGGARSASTGEIDPREGWLRRSDLEPRWFPVIRAYERARRDGARRNGAGRDGSGRGEAGREGGER